LNTVCPEIICTGCCSCYNKCPHNAISMIENNYGAIIPIINNNICVNCELCKKVCPQLVENERFEPKEVYAVWAKNKNEHLSSSSGGAASVFYRNILTRYSGICIGSLFFDNLFLRYYATENIDDIEKFKGSKYVQSYVGDIFTQIKEYVKNKRYVLFIGTPCQVDGLKSFLGDSEYLFTIDLICHGVPPVIYLQQHFKKYLKKDSKMVVSFRTNNHFRMILSFYNGKRIIIKNDIYLYAYLKGLIYRENCYHCKYAQKRRSGDITIGDFWGLSNEIASMEDAKNGCSVVMLNTKKGKELFNTCKDDFILYERTFDEACKKNNQLNYSSIPHKNRKIFLRKYKNDKFTFACVKALFPYYQIHSIYHLIVSCFKILTLKNNLL